MTGVKCECFVVGAAKKALEETVVVLHCVLTELHKVSFCHHHHQQRHVVEIECKRTSCASCAFVLLCAGFFPALAIVLCFFGFVYEYVDVAL